MHGVPEWHDVARRLDLLRGVRLLCGQLPERRCMPHVCTELILCGRCRDGVHGVPERRDGTRRFNFSFGMHG